MQVHLAINARHSRRIPCEDCTNPVGLMELGQDTALVGRSPFAGFGRVGPQKSSG